MTPTTINFSLLHQKSGIYLLTEVSTQKPYVGQSKDLLQRLSSYLYYKPKTTHRRHSLPFVERKDFSFQVLEFCDPAQLDEREAHWIREYNSLVVGYNQKVVNGTTIADYPLLVEKREKEQREKVARVLEEFVNMPLEKKDKETIVERCKEEGLTNSKQNKSYSFVKKYCEENGVCSFVSKQANKKDACKFPHLEIGKKYIWVMGNDKLED